MKKERWQQEVAEPELWLGENGVLVNTAALEERAYYFDIVRLPARGIAELMSEPVLDSGMEHAR